MNAAKARLFLPLIQALAEGKIIQYCSTYDNRWYDTVEPTFEFPLEQYRIKPEPRVMFVRFNDDGIICSKSFDEAAIDRFVTQFGGRKVKFVEVIE